MTLETAMDAGARTRVSRAPGRRRPRCQPSPGLFASKASKPKTQILAAARRVLREVPFAKATPSGCSGHTRLSVEHFEL